MLKTVGAVHIYIYIVNVLYNRIIKKVIDGKAMYFS